MSTGDNPPYVSMVVPFENEVFALGEINRMNIGEISTVPQHFDVECPDEQLLHFLGRDIGLCELWFEEDQLPHYNFVFLLFGLRLSDGLYQLVEVFREMCS